MKGHELLIIVFYLYNIIVKLRTTRFWAIFFGHLAFPWPLKNTTNFKPPQILKCHKFQSTTNMSFYSYFCRTFSLWFPIFIQVFLISEVLVFSILFHIAMLDDLHYTPASSIVSSIDDMGCVSDCSSPWHARVCSRNNRRQRSKWCENRRKFTRFTDAHRWTL